jgi:hypothetical protein
LRANEQWTSLAKKNKSSFTARGKTAPIIKKEMTKNGQTIAVRLTESEYEEWAKLGKGKWLRTYLKDSKF